MRELKMQARVKKSQQIIEIVPVSGKSKPMFKDLNTYDLYEWDELEPVKTKVVSQRASSKVIPVNIRMSLQGSIKTV